MSTLGIILVAISAVFAILFIIIRTLKGGFLGVMLKTLASLSFVITGIIGLTEIASTRLALAGGFLVIGLTLGMIGDIFLDLKVLYDNDKFYLNFGMLAFGLGHIAYFVCFTMLARYGEVKLLAPILISTGVAIILTIAIILGSKVLKLDFGKFLLQAIAYTFALTFMSVYSLILVINGFDYLLFVGMILFFLSDIVLSTQYFGGKINSKPLIAINHALYYAAQIILASLVFVL